MGTSLVTFIISIRTSSIPCYTYTHKTFIVVSANWQISKDQKYDCRCPPVQPTKEKGSKEYQVTSEAPENSNASPPPRSPIPVESSPLLQKLRHNKHRLLLSHKKNPSQKNFSQKNLSQKKYRLMYTSRPPIQQA